MAFNPGQAFQELSQRRKRPAMQVTQSQFWPAPQGGINAIGGAGIAPVTDALVLGNMIPSEFGVEVRKGYREHCDAVPLGDGIKTMIPMNPATADGTGTERLFAATSDGIYDVTIAGGVPIKVQNFAVKTDKAGWCSWTHFTTLAGQYVLLCDLANGYYVYTVATNAWAKIVQGTTPGTIDKVDPALFDQVMVWKNRVWFVERSTGRAWYIKAVGAITGDCASFEFGNKFKYGGYLKSLWNWTLDGGEGIDDYLVGISSAGDVVLYKGTDPQVATDFNMKGWWYIGKVTQGRRQCDDMGGELLCLSTQGLTQMSKIIAGMPATDEGVSLSYKINPRMNDVLIRSGLVYGWEIISNPSEQFIMVITPKETGKDYMQFVYQTQTHAWAQFYGLPIKTACMWKGVMYFGTPDNRICSYAGFSDRVLLADSGATAKAIDWNVLSVFNVMGMAGRRKRVHFLRPQFIADVAATYFIQARYDFNITAIDVSPPYTDPVSGVWNNGQWDAALWGGGYVLTQLPTGGDGMGFHVGYTMRGASAAQTRFIGVDLLFDTGGML